MNGSVDANGILTLEGTCPSHAWLGTTIWGARFLTQFVRKFVRYSVSEATCRLRPGTDSGSAIDPPSLVVIYWYEIKKIFEYNKMEVEHVRVPKSGPIPSMPGSIFEIYPGRMIIDEAEGNHEMLEITMRKMMPQQSVSQLSSNTKQPPPYFFKRPKKFTPKEIDLINSIKPGGQVPRVVGTEKEEVPSELHLFGGQQPVQQGEGIPPRLRRPPANLPTQEDIISAVNARKPSQLGAATGGPGPIRTVLGVREKLGESAFGDSESSSVFQTTSPSSMSTDATSPRSASSMSIDLPSSDESSPETKLTIQQDLSHVKNALVRTDDPMEGVEKTVANFFTNAMDVPVEQSENSMLDDRKDERGFIELFNRDQWQGQLNTETLKAIRKIEGFILSKRIQDPDKITRLDVTQNFSRLEKSMLMQHFIALANQAKPDATSLPHTRFFRIVQIPKPPARKQLEEYVKKYEMPERPVGLLGGSGKKVAVDPTVFDAGKVADANQLVRLAASGPKIEGGLKKAAKKQQQEATKKQVAEGRK